MRIVNHARVPDLDFEVRRHLVLVGTNAVGKTTVIRALNALLKASTSQLHAWFGPDMLRDQAAPLVVEATLTGLDNEDKGWFADDVEVLTTPAGPQMQLTIRLTVTLDQIDPELKTVQREFVKVAVARPVRPNQLSAIGWSYLPADRSADRELGGGRTGTARALLAEVDLGSEAADLRTALGQYQTVLDKASALVTLRESIATALSAVYPRQVNRDDMSVQLRDVDGEALLGDVDIHIRTDRGPVRLHQQSDGLRALTTIALHQVHRRAARIVAVDEPEVHLHPRAQARIGAVLAEVPQAILATQSPQVLAAFRPSEIVAFAPDGTIRQVPLNLDEDWKFRQHSWLDSTLEPLTARALVAVEGISDRVLLHALARASALDLDQAGISVVVVNGATNFGPPLRLFGPAGFNIAMLTLVDEAEAAIVAGVLGCAFADLDKHNVLISRTDLEDEYVRGLGVPRVLDALEASGMYDRRAIVGACRVSDEKDITEQSLANWCRQGKIKVAAALATQITAADAAAIPVIVDLMKRLRAL
ncbi:AAA family ATPase [Micromonospora tulbaghiae]|uniref:ATP-dependent nuclease n=1 Tax=Micromonospora tulbaghiae TaxID=479978 RepID=UPI0033BF3520